ncbi:MAG: EAL domain-containing protein, partial [Acidobacteria bacterium]|nr:EAL domain-containing protein [Acidobacteriota bacterium]
MPPVRTLAVATAAAVAVAGACLAAGWPDGADPIVFTLLLLAGTLVAASTSRPPVRHHLEPMWPSFVAEWTTLLLFGMPVSLLLTAVAEVVPGLARADARPDAIARAARLSVSLLALAAAGVAATAVTEALHPAKWPELAAPMAAAIVVHLIVRGTLAGLVVPLILRHGLMRDWPARLLDAAPGFVVGASLAGVIAEIVTREAWTVLPLALVPWLVAGRDYGVHVTHVQEQHRRRSVMDVISEGMCVVDRRGGITQWSDVLEHMLGCGAARAIGASLGGAIPSLANTETTHAVEAVLATREPRTINRVTLSNAAGSRIFRVRLLPVEEGVTLLWQDISERAREEGLVKKSEERLALAAEAASDGLWAWDLRSDECFFSGRWRGIVGLSAEAVTAGIEEWFQRVHPSDLPALKAAIDAHLAGHSDRLRHEHRVLHEDGNYRTVVCRAMAARGAGRTPTRIAGSLTERTEAGGGGDGRGAAYLDPLTGLANRAIFVERVGRRMTEARQRRVADQFAVLYLDLDRFKVVNDSLGHLVGDELLMMVARRLEECLRPPDLIGRLGGDEFAILLNGLADAQQANVIAFRIQDALSAPFSIGGREVFTTASIGIALGHADYTTPGEIMRDADTAMYHAKARGKARHELFDADMHARVRDRLGLENDLRHAVDAKDFEVHFQPIVSLATGKCAGFESLVRWKRHGEPVGPDVFIPLAEELGLIEPLGTWVLQKACRTFAEWQRQMPGRLDYIAVNVSSRQLQQQNFLRIVEQAVDHAGMQPSELRLEITETALMDSPQLAARVLRDLRDFGVKIYLDDFGTGYSSLSHLHKLPVDALKIDRSFVKSLFASDRPAIVESILALAATLNTSVVAEGVETDGQARELERLGCTHAQGYLFA